MTIAECNKRIEVLKTMLVEGFAAIGVLCQCEIERLEEKIRSLNGDIK